MKYAFTFAFGLMALAAIVFAVFYGAKFHYGTAAMSSALAFVVWKAD